MHPIYFNYKLLVVIIIIVVVAGAFRIPFNTKHENNKTVPKNDGLLINLHVITL